MASQCVWVLQPATAWQDIMINKYPPHVFEKNCTIQSLNSPCEISCLLPRIFSNCILTHVAIPIELESLGYKCFAIAFFVARAS